MPTELIPAPFAQRLPYLPMPAMGGLSRPMNVPGAIQPNGVANPWALHNALETYQPRAYPTMNGLGSGVSSIVGSDHGRFDDGWEGSAGRSSVGWAPDPDSAAGPHNGPVGYQHAPSSYGNHHPMSAVSFAMRPRAGSMGSASVYLESPVYATPSPHPRRLSVHSDVECQHGSCGHYKPAPGAARLAVDMPKRRNSASRGRAQVPREGVSPFSSSPLKNEADYMPAPRRRSDGHGRRCTACERGCAC